MKGYPKYLNSRSDYFNLLIDWPPQYAGARDQMTATLERIHSTALISVPIWPKGYDPDDVEHEPVQPVAYKKAEDLNGEIYRIGMDPQLVAELLALVNHLDPLIECLEQYGAEGETKTIDDQVSILLDNANKSFAALSSDLEACVKAVDGRDVGMLSQSVQILVGQRARLLDELQKTEEA